MLNKDKESQQLEKKYQEIHMLKDQEIELEEIDPKGAESNRFLDSNSEVYNSSYYDNINNNKSSGSFFRDCFSSSSKYIYRTINMQGKCIPRVGVKNAVKNQKYSLITFLPKVLYQQFKYFFNFFYLAICISQFIPVLKVGFLFTYAAPLAFVIILTMAKEAYDDFKRYQKDKEANSSKYTCYIKGQQKIVKSCDIKPGDIVLVNTKQRIPADLILLSTNEQQGTVFIRTDQLDGETDWKVRRAIRSTQSQINFENPYQINQLNSLFQFDHPNSNIHEFQGIYQQENGQQEALNLENTLWANTILATGKILGIVIFVGKETRIAMNSREPVSKYGIFDEEVNKTSKILFFIMLIISLIILFLSGFPNQWFIQFFRYLLLLSSIIPISMRVNLDFSKAFFSYHITNDKSIPDTMARNSNIPEELGRINYLLSDKTGTLTQNQMKFKKLVVNEQIFTEENKDDLIKIIAKITEKHNGPLGDINEEDIGKKQRRKNEYIIRDLATALALCHNVTPVYEDDIKTLQASSPDEFALVQLAEELSLILEQRDDDSISLKNSSNNYENYDILANFPFTSESKRMGIILRHKTTNKIIFYCKGADVVMIQKVKPIFKAIISDECDNLAREGLRTLVICQRYLTSDQYNQWKQEYDKASVQMNDRANQIKKTIESLENNLELLGVTGVEDKLQDDVQGTIEALVQAGIRIWMLTGDKVETAKCISISAGLKSVQQEIYEIIDKTDEEMDQFELREKLLQFSHMNNNILLIDGSSLSKLLQHHESLFFQTAAEASAVICCRCAPKQKSQIAEKLMNLSKKRVACIGDGGNDVGMIQCSHVGIGIKGKEGMQAALASDFSISEFKSLKTLLLWHGRNSFKRSSVLTHFIIHRGLVISVIQMMFTCVFYFVAIPIYNGWLMLGYATIYTSLPVFCLIFDEDIDKKKTLEFPPLYKSIQKNRDMSLKTFLTWFWVSIYQGSIIMLLSIILFQDSFLTIVTITFTALIFSELLNIYSQIHILHPMMLVSQFFTFLIYLLSILLLSNYIQTSKITAQFFFKVLIIVCVSWLPIHICREVLKRMYPSEEKKLMRDQSVKRDILGIIVGILMVCAITYGIFFN